MEKEQLAARGVVLRVREGTTMSSITTINSSTGQDVRTDAVISEQATIYQVEACHTAFHIAFRAAFDAASLEWRILTHKLDRDGAKRLIDPAQDAGVTRFVMPSSVGADQSNPTGDMAHDPKCKHEAGDLLKTSGPSYAILRPVAFTTDGHSADVLVGANVDKSAKASRAHAVHAQIEAATSGRFDGSTRDTPCV